MYRINRAIFSFSQKSSFLWTLTFQVFVNFNIHLPVSTWIMPCKNCRPCSLCLVLQIFLATTQTLLCWVPHSKKSFWHLDGTFCNHCDQPLLLQHTRYYTWWLGQIWVYKISLSTLLKFTSNQAHFCGGFICMGLQLEDPFGHDAFFFYQEPNCQNRSLVLLSGVHLLLHCINPFRQLSYFNYWCKFCSIFRKSKNCWSVESALQVALCMWFPFSI